MELLTPDLRAALRANAEARRAAQAADAHEPDPAPLVKLFNPVGAATWLATELDSDGDTLFGLADLGFGCPELGSFSLAELTAVRLPFGLGIERDLSFASLVPLSVWADMARAAGSILDAAAALRPLDAKFRAALALLDRDTDPDPLPPPDPGGG
ncbi:DUF2958 domain-containing protein [Sphingomonas sp.]|jgi:hypothetical protein|uniref:DUF2958 domain-containing protein n=1 Tax=Sphingomonas sp. TaxID=28214 RepID=UPI002E3797CB|nr:DUF2958 domain-containing protein [Sphingomonas sp.]HEX4693602.1 DUF2958 domain-containing protein [Sphingomonas sp.]